jgi:hypothetical protein
VTPAGTGLDDPGRGERGQVTFLGLGLALALLAVGGFSVDLWRVLAERRALAEAADAAAAAGANGVDLEWYRSSGELRLDSARALALAAEHLGRHPGAQRGRVTRLDAGPEEVVVGLETDVELTLLRLFTLGEPVTVAVTAESRPVRGP